MQTILCFGALFSTGFGLHFVHQLAPDQMVNDWDQPLQYTPGVDRAFVGMKSHHDNHYEDRKYQMYFTEGEGLRCNPLSWSDWQNDWDQPFTFVCPPHHAVAGIQSVHNNDKEDRRWKFQCCDLQPGGYRVHSTTVSGWINKFDEPADFECNPQEVMVGAMSEHSNNREDRRWRIYCGLLRDDAGVMEQQQVFLSGNGPAGTINEYHENFAWSYSPSGTRFFNGLYSHHDNQQEDRQWRPYYADYHDDMTCQFQPWTDFQNSGDDYFEFQCPHNSIMVGLGGEWNGGRHDRRFKFRCCTLGGGWQVTSIRHMGYANDMDGDMTGKCAWNEALLGFNSYHHNSEEDRVFNVICGMLEKDYDDCTEVSVVEYTIDEDAIVYGDEQIKTMAQYTAELEQCGSPNAATDVTIRIENTASIEVSESFTLSESLEEHFAFSQEIETTFTIGQTVTTAIEAGVNAGMFSSGASTEVSTSYEFSLRTLLASEQGFTMGSEETSTTETTTANIQVFSTEATFEPEAYQWHTITAQYNEREVIVPVRMEARCLRADGTYKTSWIDTQVIGAAYTTVAVRHEDITAMCPQSYYHECECVTGLASDFIGTGCQLHPNFNGHMGCYVYGGQNGCGNGGGLAAAQPAANQIICTDLDQCPGSQSYLDYPVDANVFEWSYVPCGGEQYYPGDSGYTGPEYGDLVWLRENMHCAEGGTGTFGSTAYSSRNEAITACDFANYEVPDSCLGVYDGNCDGKNSFYLCATPFEDLKVSDTSCVWEMQDKDPETPIGGGRRRSSGQSDPAAAPTGGQNGHNGQLVEEIWSAAIDHRTCAELQLIFGNDLDLTGCRDGSDNN